MLSVARIRPGQWAIYKTLRLAALLESPHAFGSTYAENVGRLDAEWQEMAAARAESPDNALFLVFDGAEAVGLAGAYQNRRGDMELISVWVAPDHRGTGAAEMVVEAACDWAASGGAASIIAYVTEGNRRALRFYHRLGFRDTGRRFPHRPDTDVMEIETSRRLAR